MSHLLRRFTAESERIEDERKIGRIVLGAKAEENVNAKRIGNRSAAGDPFRLRAIPVIARGVGGCIPGTNPQAALDSSERVR